MKKSLKQIKDTFKKPYAKGLLRGIGIATVMLLLVKLLVTNGIEYYNIKLNPKYSQKPSITKIVNNEKKYIHNNLITTNEGDYLLLTEETKHIDNTTGEFIAEHTDILYDVEKEELIKNDDLISPYFKSKSNNYYFDDDLEESGEYTIDILDANQKTEFSIETSLTNFKEYNLKTSSYNEIQKWQNAFHQKQHFASNVEGNKALIAKVLTNNNTQGTEIVIFLIDLDNQNLISSKSLDLGIDDPSGPNMHSIYLHFYNNSYFLFTNYENSLYYQEITIDSDNNIITKASQKIEDIASINNYKIYAQFSTHEQYINIFIEEWGEEIGNQEYFVFNFELEKATDQNPETSYVLKQNNGLSVSDLVTPKPETSAYSRAYLSGLQFETQFKCDSKYCYILKPGLPINYLEFMSSPVKEITQNCEALTLTKISTKKQDKTSLSLNYLNKFKNYQETRINSYTKKDWENLTISREIIWLDETIYYDEYSWHSEEGYLDIYYLPMFKNGVNKIRIKL